MITPAQCRAARGLLAWTQGALAEAAGVGLSSVVDLEKERRDVSEDIKAKIRSAIVDAGVMLIAENGGGAGVRMKRAERRPSR